MASPSKAADGGVPVVGTALESGPFYPADGCCTICFMDLSTTCAVQFQCQHVICATCVLQTFSETKLAECSECSTPCSRQRAALMVAAAAEADEASMSDLFPGKSVEELVAGLKASVEDDKADGQAASAVVADPEEASEPAIGSSAPLGDGEYRDLLGSTPFSMTVEEASSQLEQAFTGVNSSDADTVAKAVFIMRKALSSTSSPPCDQVVAAGVLPRLVELMANSGDERVVFEATWCVTNVASGTTEQTRHVVDVGAVPVLLELLGSPAVDIREQAVWCLGNICGDGPELRDLCIAHGLPERLAQLLESDSVRSRTGFRRNVVWAASNVCRGKPRPTLQTLQTMVPALAAMLLDDDAEVLTDACWALSYASDGPNERIQLLLDCGLVERVMELMHHASSSVLTPALRVVGNIVTGDDAQTAAAIDAGCVPVLVPLLGHPKESLRKEAAWTLSNIFAGTPEQIQVCLEAGSLLPLINLIESDTIRVGKEALWAVANGLTGCTSDQLDVFLEAATPSALTNALSRDSSYLPIATEAIVKLVERRPSCKDMFIASYILDQISGLPPSSEIEQLSGIFE